MSTLFYSLLGSVLSSTGFLLISRATGDSDVLIFNSLGLSSLSNTFLVSAPVAVILTGFAKYYISPSKDHGAAFFVAAFVAQTIVILCATSLGFYAGGIATIAPMIIAPAIAVYLLDRISGKMD